MVGEGSGHRKKERASERAHDKDDIKLHTQSPCGMIQGDDPGAAATSESWEVHSQTYFHSICECHGLRSGRNSKIPEGWGEVEGTGRNKQRERGRGKRETGRARRAEREKG